MERCSLNLLPTKNIYSFIKTEKRQSKYRTKPNLAIIVEVCPQAPNLSGCSVLKSTLASHRAFSASALTSPPPLKVPVNCLSCQERIGTKMIWIAISDQLFFPRDVFIVFVQGEPVGKQKVIIKDWQSLMAVEGCAAGVRRYTSFENKQSPSSMASHLNTSS